jgi:probable selenium-dependent hydroxylase accessory protein YqeC
MELHSSMKIGSEKRVIALAGGGGKTTSLYALARESAAAGRRTVLMTTTHIGIPKRSDVDVYMKADAAGMERTWSAGRIVAVGKVGPDGRMNMPDEKTFAFISSEAEAIYIEADGSKCLPLKYPDWYEPVIPANVDQVLVISGLSALDKPFDTFCHRAALARQKLGTIADRIDEKTMAQILSAGYGKYQPTIILNQADTPELRQRGEYIASLLLQAGIAEVSVLSMHQLLGIKEG